jgi:hypothetical protein
MRKATLAILLGGLSMACGDSATVTSPEPSPSAGPQERLVVVAVVGVQNGSQGVTRVQAGSEFKINATASRCYVDRVEVSCTKGGFAIPYWSQRQTGGAPCEAQGDINSASVQYVCNSVGPGRAFEACALDFDQKSMGCGTWEMSVF